MKISDRQVNNVWILLFKNLIITVVLHLQVELLSFRLNIFDCLNFWNDELIEIIFSKLSQIIILVIHKAVTSAPEWWKSFGFSLWTLNVLVRLLIVHHFLASLYILIILNLFQIFYGLYKTTNLRNVNILIVLLLLNIV